MRSLASGPTQTNHTSTTEVVMIPLSFHNCQAPVNLQVPWSNKKILKNQIKWATTPAPLCHSPACSELSACCPGVHGVTPSLCMCPHSTKMRHVCCLFIVQNLLFFLKSFVSRSKESAPHAPSSPAPRVCEFHVGSHAPLLPWAPEP